MFVASIAASLRLVLDSTFARRPKTAAVATAFSRILLQHLCKLQSLARSCRCNFHHLASVFVCLPSPKHLAASPRLNHNREPFHQSSSLERPFVQSLSQRSTGVVQSSRSINHSESGLETITPRAAYGGGTGQVCRHLHVNSPSVRC